MTDIEKCLEAERTIEWYMETMVVSLAEVRRCIRAVAQTDNKEVKDIMSRGAKDEIVQLTQRLDEALEVANSI